MKNTDHYFQKEAQKWVNGAYQGNQAASVATERLDAVKQVVAQLAPNSVLDIGCGDGRFLRSLTNVARRVGVDYSKAMLDAAGGDEAGLHFESLDINTAADRQKLQALGSFDLLTLLGLVHYLEDPETTLKSIAQNGCSGSFLAISFRNRLFNISPLSIYATSKLTQQDFPGLIKEGRFWTKQTEDSTPDLKEISTDPDGAAVIEVIVSRRKYVGATDNAWNPDHLENWRQFTPFEAIVLLDRSGFSPQAIYPLHLHYLAAGGNTSGRPANQANVLPFCTSFLALAKWAGDLAST